MYHLKRSLRSGCGVSAACSPCPACPSSSSILCSRFAPVFSCLESAQLAQQLMQAHIEDRVHYKEIHPEDEDRDDDHGRCGLDFLARRRYHLPHFPAYIGEELRKL